MSQTTGSFGSLAGDGVDVLIVGDGIAGCVTAISAQSSGARVAIVDKAPADVPHGNTAFSGGAFRRVSAAYSREAFLEDLIQLSGGRADREIAATVVDRSRAAQDWLEEIGVRWTASTRDAGDYAEAEGKGVGLAAAVRRAVDVRGIPVFHRTEAVELRRDAAVTGLRVRDNSGATSVIDAKATVLACGGFSANAEMVTRYIGDGARHLVLRGSPFNTGDGLRLAADQGAQLDWMDDFHGGLIHFAHKKYPEEGALRGMRHVQNYEFGILVNQGGRRFVDEGENTSVKTYAKFGKIVPLTQQDGVAYVVFDARNLGIIDPVYKGPESEPFSAPTLAELADRIGVPRVAFLETVEAYNAGIRDGRNLDIDPPKTNFAEPIDQPPYYAHKVTGGFTFTFGGLRTTMSGEVLDTASVAIPGLFAVGEITTGLFYGNYAGGSSLPKCTVFGRIVGEAVADAVQRQHS